MRNRGMVLVLMAGAVLAGYAFGDRALQAQGPVFPVEVGQRITLGYDSGSGVSCHVAAISGEFVRCESRRDDRVLRRPRPETWYNVRVAQWLTTDAADRGR
jgi:hypothetical protein